MHDLTGGWDAEPERRLRCFPNGTRFWLLTPPFRRFQGRLERFQLVGNLPGDRAWKACSDAGVFVSLDNYPNCLFQICEPTT